MVNLLIGFVDEKFFRLLGSERYKPSSVGTWLSFAFSSVVFTRQLIILGTVGSSLFLVLIGYVGCNRVAAMCCITLAVSFIGFHSSGCQISHLDIASNYAGNVYSIERFSTIIRSHSLGTLVGITNTLAAIPGFVAPYIVGAITNNNVSTSISFEQNVDIFD